MNAIEKIQKIEELIKHYSDLLNTKRKLYKDVEEKFNYLNGNIRGKIEYCGPDTARNLNNLFEQAAKEEKEELANDVVHIQETLDRKINEICLQTEE